MDNIITFIDRIGFPVFVSVFLLIRINPALQQINTTLARLLQYLENHQND